MRLRKVLIVSAVLWCSVSLGAPDAAEEAYQQARKSYYVLKDDAHRRKFRHNWLNVVRRFEAVAQSHPKSGRAPDALFTSAELLAELSRISMLDEDLQHAIRDYEKLIESYPKSSLADDAALLLARIHIERTGKIDAARKVLTHALERLPKGDMHKKLRELRAELPAGPEKRATGTRIAARDVKSAPESKTPEEKGTPVAEAPKAEPPQQAPSEANREALLAAIARASGQPSPEPTAVAEAPVKTEAPAKNEATAKSEAPPKSSAPAEVASDAAVARKTEPKVADEKIDPKEAKARINAALKGGRQSDITLAEQLGLKVRRIVIDAGHGGHDTGAIGRKGTREKDVTLAISKRVAELLSERGLEVVLTRTDDTFVRLEDRARIANEQKGDLFISIHCNAAESRKLRGIETYSLNVASDRYSIRLAARENASSEKSISDLQFILADLATKANTEESQRLASRVQQSMVGRLGGHYKDIRDLGTKQALFYVLLGAKMPSILVETSFLSHPDEEKRLATKAYQEHLAQAIASGVEAFLEDRHRVASVD